MTLYAVADFCLIPMGTPTPSVGIYIAKCQQVLESMADKGIKFEDPSTQMHGYGTNLEGTFAAVSEAIEACHAAVHAMGVPRIATDIRIGTRVDKAAPGKGEAALGEEWTAGLGENERKKESVRRILAGESSKKTAAQGDEQQQA